MYDNMSVPFPNIVFLLITLFLSRTICARDLPAQLPVIKTSILLNEMAKTSI